MNHDFFVPAPRGLAVFTLCLLAACSPTPPAALPPLPEVSMDGALPAIREQVDTAWIRADARPPDAEANGRLGMVLATYNRFDAAHAAYRRARLLAPGDHRWPYLEGHVLGFQGRAADAAQALRDALALQPRDPHIRIELANQLLATGDLDESRRLYEAAIAQDPKLLRAHLGLGRLLARTGDPQGAAARLRAAVAVDGRIGEIHYALAQALRELGDEAAAAQHLLLAERYRERRARDHDPALAALGQLHLGDRPHMVRAGRLIAENRRAEAVSALLDALQANPRNDAAHTHLVWLYGLAGQPDEAAKHFHAALAINPDNAQLHFNRGHLLRKQGRYPEAEQALDRAVGLDPGLAAAWVQLGYVLEQQGRGEAALGHYRTALRLDPDQRNARFLLGKALARAGRPDDAIAQLRRSLEPEDGRTPVYLRTLAAVYLAQGESAAARAALQRAQAIARRQGNRRLAAAAEADLHRLASEHLSPLVSERTDAAAPAAGNGP